MRSSTWAVAFLGLVGLVALRAAPIHAAHMLKLVQVLNQPGGVTRDLFGLAMSPDGKHVYIGAGYSGEGYVIVLQRDPVTGVLTPIENEPFVDEFFIEYLGVVVSPDGKNVYATNWGGSTAMSSYGRDATTGQLTNLNADLDFDTVEEPWDVAFSPDGTELYVAGIATANLTVLARNPMTGILTFVRRNYLDGAGGNQVHFDASGVAVSPDGRDVYVESYEMREVVSYHLLPGGNLDFVGIFGEDFGDSGPIYDAHGLAVGGAGVTMSPDGRNVYTNARFPGVGEFSRDPATGQLTLLDVAAHGVGATDYKTAMGMHPDGRWVYASAGELAVFARDRVTGRLTLADEHSEVYVGQIVVSPDGRHVYVAGTDDTRVAIYRFMGCTEVPDTGCRQQSLPRKGSLTVRNDANDGKDAVVWSWANGAATTVADFADPLTNTDYAFCLYDQSGPGGSPRLLAASTTPPGGTCRTKPCWKKLTKVGVDAGYSYVDALRTKDGLNRIILKSGGPEAAKISVKAGGVELGSPAPPFVGIVTAQLKATATGACWEARYSTPTLNQGGTFRAKGD